jgi:Icc-related predicted phosphoesterase
MNLLVIADDESVGQRLPECDVDVLVSCGDLADAVILDAARRCRCREILAVKGNHDSSGPFPAPIQDLHLKVIQFRGVTFGGFCGSWKYKPKGNYLFEESEVEQLMAKFPPVDVLVAHNSPRHVHDREDEVHLGFSAFNNYIARASPRMFLHGHQHEHIESRIGRTRIIGTYGHRMLVIPE